RLKAPHKDLYGVPLSSTKLILHGRMLYALSNYVGPLVAQGTLEGIHVHVDSEGHGGSEYPLI
ncbi:MAG: hypothetical protein EBS79_06195, partial [Gammaproteobacteria bacterium]|nr:hypothetical protein [Gammaproteobacteria bacterium]